MATGTTRSHLGQELIDFLIYGRALSLDIHRAFAEVATLEKGTIRHAGRFTLEHKCVTDFGKSLKRTDEVVVEATGKTAVVVRLLKP